MVLANSKEEVVVIRDEIKVIPNGAEKSTLQQEYLKKCGMFIVNICNNISKNPKVFKKNADIHITKEKFEKGVLENDRRYRQINRIW